MNLKSNFCLLSCIIFASFFLLASCSNQQEKQLPEAQQKTTSTESPANQIPDSIPAVQTSIDTSQAVAAEPENKITPPIQTTKKSALKEPPVKPQKKNPAPEPKKTETKPLVKNEPAPPAAPVKPKKDSAVAPAAPVVKKQVAKQPEPPAPPQAKEPTLEKPAPPIPPVNETPTKQTKPEVDNHWPVPAKDRDNPNPVKVDKESLSWGKSLYKQHCASCHGKSGLGDGSKAAQLDTSPGDFSEESFQNQTDGALYYKVRIGRDDMPSFKKKLPEPEDIWSIVNYLRTLK